MHWFFSPQIDAFSVLQVSKLGFGCVGLTGTYNAPLSEEDGISIIRHAFSEGVTFFDTADAYGANANEILVGKVWTTSLSSELCCWCHLIRLFHH